MLETPKLDGAISVEAGKVSHSCRYCDNLSPFALGEPRESSKYGDLRAGVSPFLVLCEVPDYVEFGRPVLVKSPPAGTSHLSISCECST